MDHKMRKMDQNNNHSSKRFDRTEVIRKKRKPLMEKRRRARINASLEQLKKLVLDATRRDSARYSKLEKADILELTVKHIKEVNRGVPQDASLFAKLHDGFGECVAEVNRCLSAVDGVPPELHARLMGHLSTCLQRRVGPIGGGGGVPGAMPHPGMASPLSPTSPGHLPPNLAASLALAHQQQEMAAAFHQHQQVAALAVMSSGGSSVSPSGHANIPRATALQSLPGAAASAFEQAAARNLNGGNNGNASSAQVPGTATMVTPAHARDFHSALMQAQSEALTSKERALSMERLINSAAANDGTNGNTGGATNAQFMKQLSKLQKMKSDPGVGSGKMESALESFYIRQQMLALEHGDNVWRPW